MVFHALSRVIAMDMAAKEAVMEVTAEAADGAVATKCRA
jgi:hypothetical protein